MDSQNSFIQAEEALLKVNKEWIHFTSPHRVIQANTLHDVIPTLREIEDLVQINAGTRRDSSATKLLQHSTPRIRPGRERDSHICVSDSSPRLASSLFPNLIH